MLKYLAPALCLLAAPALAQGMSVKKLDPALDNVIAPGTKIEKVATGFIFIEGPMWKDGKLWFSDVRMDKVRTFDPKTNKVTVVLNDSGGLKNAPPDGKKVDSAGNLWATGPGGVRIISPKGKVLGQIVIPEIVANVGFAEDGKTVYLTGSTSLYRLHSKIAGEIPMYYRK